MNKIENKALFELVYDRIKSMVDDGILKPGEKIDKKNLAELLGVSQTPLNEALSKLAGEKIIEQRSREGFFIYQYSYLELSQLFELRATIEGMAARLCAEHMQDDEIVQVSKLFDNFTLPLSAKRHRDYYNADKQFHECLVKCSKNPFLVDIFVSSGYFSKSNQKGLLRPAEDTLPEHMMVINALKNRDAHLAQELIIIHFLRTRDFLLALWTNQENTAQK